MMECSFLPSFLSHNGPRSTFQKRGSDHMTWPVWLPPSTEVSPTPTWRLRPYTNWPQRACLYFPMFQTNWPTFSPNITAFSASTRPWLTLFRPSEMHSHPLTPSPPVKVPPSSCGTQLPCQLSPSASFVSPSRTKQFPALLQQCFGTY